jgi:hypothetical protein
MKGYWRSNPGLPSSSGPLTSNLGDGGEGSQARCGGAIGGTVTWGFGGK